MCRLWPYLLIQTRNFGVFHHTHVTCIRFHLAANNPQHCRLACAIPTHETHALPLIHGEGHILQEHGRGCECLGQLGYRERLRR